MIFEINAYVNDEGSKIEQLIPIESQEVNSDEEKNNNMSQFVGVAHMVSDYATTEVRFPIENVSSLKEAFAGFENSLNSFMEEMKSQMAEQSSKPEIIVPDATVPDIL
tara:strand:+ start:15254 stop:15577 length:324 start_codon:yes stop_codon:yes gene_type:complete